MVFRFLQSSETLSIKILCLSKIGINADIVQTPCFESGIVKIQRGLETSLSHYEKLSVKTFLKAPIEEEDEEIAVGGGGGEGPVDHRGRLLSPTRILIEGEERIQEKAKLPRLSSAYSSTVHAKPTSNDCERLFSQLKLILNDHRHRMEPSTTEAILFLKVNSKYWDIRDVAQVLSSVSTVEPDVNEDIDAFDFAHYNF